MEKQKICYGLVGCGTISDTHARAIERTSEGQLTAVYSRNGDKASRFAREFDAEPYTDYETFLAHDKLDAVVICTPSGTHLDYGIAAARAGRHVVVEKPIEVNMERGRALLEACEKNGVRLTVIYQNRFIDDVAAMKRAFDDGVLGQPVMVTASVKWFRDDEYYRNAPWRGTLKLDGGGAVINQAIHTVDLLQWIAGDIREISAYTGTLTHDGIEGEDNAVACFRLSSGALGVFQASTSIRPPQKRKLAIHGTEGTAVLDGDRLTIWKSNGEEVDPAGWRSGTNPEPGSQSAAKTGTSAKKADSSTGSGASAPLAGMSFENHYRQYETINASLINGSEMAVSGEEALKSLAAVEALYQSAGRRK
ncbi:Gfo/Idh/MocA family oxidoreductase [Balneolales bacterium ANBcel1]|nr:Gfo/Idh/MocA family oxidoreductase [Balneolales bacterium ANBcel1]